MATSMTVRSVEDLRRLYRTSSLGRAGSGSAPFLARPAFPQSAGGQRPTRRWAGAGGGAKTTTASRMERRVSERGSCFLPLARSRDLSSAKFRTALTERPARQAGPRPTAGAADFRTLASARLVLPTYIVAPAEAPVAIGCTSRSHEENGSIGSRVDESERGKLRVKEWYDLVMRPVSRRPDYAQPIICKTPKDVTPHFDYLRPKAGLFYSVDRALPRKTYEVSPEFMSESKRSIAIREMASNTLKFGWG